MIVAVQYKAAKYTYNSGVTGTESFGVTAAMLAGRAIEVRAVVTQSWVEKLVEQKDYTMRIFYRQRFQKAGHWPAKILGIVPAVLIKLETGVHSV